MITFSNLRENDFPGFRVEGPFAERLTLDLIETYIGTHNLLHYDLPIGFYKDEVKSGGFLSSNTQSCLVLYNTNFPNDYFKYCFMLEKAGSFATIRIYYFGISTLTQKKHQTEERRKKGLGGMLANALVGVDESAYLSEYEFYRVLNELISGAFDSY